MPEIHVAAHLTNKVRRGDLLQIRMPFAVREGDELVLHITTTNQPVAHATTGQFVGVGTNPRTGLRSKGERP